MYNLVSLFRLFVWVWHRLLSSDNKKWLATN